MSQKHQFRIGLAVTALLSIQTLLLGWIAYRTTPNVDEIGHLPAGLMVYEFGRFDGYKVNPPLVKAIGALPVWLLEPEYDWSWFEDGPGDRPEWTVGRAFVSANRERSLWFWTVARWACIPFAWLGGFVCYRWASELYGQEAGLVAITLWCFSPNVLAWGATICADLAAASLGITTCYVFAKWLRRPGIGASCVCGLILGLAQLSKTSWLCLYGLLPLVWVCYRVRSKSADQSVPTLLGLIGLLSLSLYVLNAGYAFQGTGTWLGEFQFTSSVLSGRPLTDRGQPPNIGNRFVGTWLAQVPVPVPKPYVEGVDLQKLDLERGGWSYLRGAWQKPGWWYWYLYAVLVKVPVGTLLLGGLAFLTIWGGSNRQNQGQACGRWSDAICLILPPLALFTIVSINFGFTLYLRYVLPCFPFAFVFVSRVVACGGKWRLMAHVAIGCSVLSSVVGFPHSIGYFNAAAGGIHNAHKHVLHASVDFGQNGIYLAEFLESHPELENVRVDVQFTLPFPAIGIVQAKEHAAEWLVLDATRLYGKDDKYEVLRDAVPEYRLPCGLMVFKFDPRFIEEKP